MRIFRSRLLTYLKNYEVKNIFLRFPVIFFNRDCNGSLVNDEEQGSASNS